MCGWPSSLSWNTTLQRKNICYLQTFPSCLDIVKFLQPTFLLSCSSQSGDSNVRTILETRRSQRLQARTREKGIFKMVQPHLSTFNSQWYVDSSSILRRAFSAGLGANWKSNPEHSECVSLASLIEVSCVQSAWQNRRAMQECYTQKPNGSPVTTQKICNPPHSSKDSYIMESIVNEHSDGLDTCFIFCNLRCLTA